MTHIAQNYYVLNEDYRTLLRAVGEIADHMRGLSVADTQMGEEFAARQLVMIAERLERATVWPHHPSHSDVDAVTEWLGQAGEIMSMSDSQSSL